MEGRAADGGAGAAPRAGRGRGGQRRAPGRGGGRNGRGDRGPGAGRNQEQGQRESRPPPEAAASAAPQRDGRGRGRGGGRGGQRREAPRGGGEPDKGGRQQTAKDERGGSPAGGRDGRGGRGRTRGGRGDGGEAGGRASEKGGGRNAHGRGRRQQSKEGERREGQSQPADEKKPSDKPGQQNPKSSGVEGQKGNPSDKAGRQKSKSSGAQSGKDSTAPPTKGGGSSSEKGGGLSSSHPKTGQRSSAQQKEQALLPMVPPNQPQQTSDVFYGKGSGILILHVAEKPSIAQAITKGLAPSSSAVDFRKSALPVHEFQTRGGGAGGSGAFPKAPHATQCTHRVTSVAGHVFSVDFPPQFQSWDSVDPAELFGAPVERKPQKGSVVKHLQDQARGVDFIVLWMDCDKEGENINYEVLSCCMHLMKSGGSGTNFDRVYRAHFSAINPSDIQKAYHALGKPDQNQALAVDARQELDLKIGVAFSRFQTRYFQGRYGDLDSSVLSYGPCQTPTLGFCVQRHIDIETFKPEPYWVLELGIIKRGRTLRALWNSGRSFNKGRVEALHQSTAAAPLVVVKNLAKKEKKQGRPVPLNTVALLKACSKALGIGPHSAMQAAERLYLSGYLSYPRTESSSYPNSFDIAGTLKQQSSDGRWGAYVRRLLQEGPNKSRGGVDMGDHPPITPCRSAGPNELSGDMARIYDLVVRHFIASVSQDAVWTSTRVDFSIDALADKGGFTLRGKQLVSPGFLEVLLHKEYGEEAERLEQGDDDEDEEEREIPEFNVGETIPLISSAAANVSQGAKVNVATGVQTRANLEIKEKKTTPPLPLSESELITLMEKNQIGTDASIPTHIENIQKRNYVTLESGRRLHPSKLGLVLVQGYHQIDSSLVLPRVRSDIEDQCNQIAKGKAAKDSVVKKALDLFKAKFDVFVASIGKMDLLFGASFSKLEDIGKPFTRCGLTRRYLQFIPGPPQRLYNKWTETVYPLPEGGVVKQWTGRSCPVDGCNFELCLYSVGQPQRTFPLCPRCFNDPEWALDADDLPEDPIDREDEGKERVIRRTVAGRSLTLECPLPDHHPSIAELTVSPDPDSDGVLIVDPHFGPKWRLVSTRDPTIVHFPPSVEKVTILDKVDDVLSGSHLIQVEFKEGQSPLPDKKARHTCCFASDEALQAVVRVFRGSERTKATFRGRGGRGRGRGGRGRGGGRGGRGRM